MSNKGSFLFLGTGSSMGIPVIGCSCAVCCSDSPYNQRLRPGALVEVESKSILIDAGPEFRIQALKHCIQSLDGVIFTHAHFDHTAGLDDLRIFDFKRKKPLPCLLSEATLNDLKKRFHYIFIPDPLEGQWLARFELQLLPEARGFVDFLGIKTHYVTYEQGGMLVNGFRFGNLAYISDIRHYPPSLLEDLANIDILILSALRFTPSHLHLSIDEAVELALKINAKTTWLTHISHDLDYEKTNAYLPREIQLAYDGLKLDFQIF